MNQAQTIASLNGIGELSGVEQLAQSLLIRAGVNASSNAELLANVTMILLSYWDTATQIDEAF